MITETDRINTCIEKYGLSEEEARRIVKEDNMVLTVEELRMKFDNPDLGKCYPEWLTPIEHYKMCCATVRQMYNGNFAQICTPEELASTLFINTSIKLNTFKNHKHLKAGLVTNAMRICRDNMRRQKYWSGQSLDDTVSSNSSQTVYDTIVAKDIEKEESDCLNTVLSIKNREVREILILAGFIIGGINSFELEFKKILLNSDLIDRSKLIELLDTLDSNDKIDWKKLDDKKFKAKKTKITLKSILNVVNTDLDLKSARLEIGEYLATTGFIAN